VHALTAGGHEEVQTWDNCRGDFLFPMARFKLVKGKSKTAVPGARGGVPCVILLVSGMFLVSLLFYAILKSS
jgi:hypothetical protein